MTERYPYLLVDMEAKAAYVELQKGVHHKTEFGKGFNIDRDAAGNVLGIELLDLPVIEWKPKVTRVHDYTQRVDGQDPKI